MFHPIVIYLWCLGAVDGCWGLCKVWWYWLPDKLVFFFPSYFSIYFPSKILANQSVIFFSFFVHNFLPTFHYLVNASMVEITGSWPNSSSPVFSSTSLFNEMSCRLLESDRKRLYSEGASSGEYSECGRTFQPSTWIAVLVRLATWGLALSCWRSTPCSRLCCFSAGLPHWAGACAEYKALHWSRCFQAFYNELPHYGMQRVCEVKLKFSSFLKCENYFCARLSVIAPLCT